MSVKQRAERAAILRELGRPHVEAWLSNDKGIRIRLRSDQINDLMERVGAAIEAEQRDLQSQVEKERDEWCSVAEKYQALVTRTENDTVTRMRERCVEAIKGLWTTRKGNDYNSALNHAIERVESLTLEGKKEQ